MTTILDTARAIDTFVDDLVAVSLAVQEHVHQGTTVDEMAKWIRQQVYTGMTSDVGVPLYIATDEASQRWARREVAKAKANIESDAHDDDTETRKYDPSLQRIHPCVRCGHLLVDEIETICQNRGEGCAK
jgi:hypothetical protein